MPKIKTIHDAGEIRIGKVKAALTMDMLNKSVSVSYENMPLTHAIQMNRLIANAINTTEIACSCTLMATSHPCFAAVGKDQNAPLVAIIKEFLEEFAHSVSKNGFKRTLKKYGSEISHSAPHPINLNEHTEACGVSFVEGIKPASWDR